jgi:hypothetical protein
MIWDEYRYGRGPEIYKAGIKPRCVVWGGTRGDRPDMYVYVYAYVCI